MDFISRSEFRATIPIGTHLVTADFVRAMRGISVEAVQDMAESGQLQFAWDVSAKQPSKVKELRFWLPEIVLPVPRPSTLAEVIKSILGERREQWRTAEVSQMLMLSRPALHRLCCNGTLPGEISAGTFYIRRKALERFLRERYFAAN